MGFEEQILSTNEYPSIFLRQIEAYVFILFQIFSRRNTRSFENWGIYVLLDALLCSIAEYFYESK